MFDSFSEFVIKAGQNRTLAFIVILTLGVIFVNGWTDAPNAIATAVATRAITVKRAILMAAVCDFLGVFFMTMVNAKVAQTIYHIVDFKGDAKQAYLALASAMAAIVIWAVIAFLYGIPTSESHALVAGLTGAAIALHKNFDGVNKAEWGKVIYGLIISSFLGFSLGYLIVQLLEVVFQHTKREKAERFFTGGQIAGSAMMSFMHGAQDGQKFMGVFLLGAFLARGEGTITEFEIPIWLMMLCSVFMALGTCLGGGRIIKKVGISMVKLSGYEGFSADVAAAISLLIASLWGVPVSTTHTKTTAIMGVGAARSMRNVNWKVVKEMVAAWLLTFPGCGALGYLIAYFFLYAV
ncbi:MAG: inorganic phosphate transporter [Lachnospiraceae bacterium]|nr:inorganic phosphate transporter [Lachnospiraceae bacterium]